MMKCKKHPNGTCPHAKKTFEELKKGFPYFEAKNLPMLQASVCHLCKSEWDIPRFNFK